MAPYEIDPRHTFDAFVVGSANRLAAAAARRVAESPGQTYNPLFVYSASGLGKTHLLMAIGNEARRLRPELVVRYDMLERFLDEVIAAIEAGERDAFRGKLGDTGVLLLDDVQFLAGRHRSQEELLRVLDLISARGGQVVLASDRPPPEIDALDDRLLSRFSGGLIVDIGAPDYETRVAIVRRKADERGQILAPGVEEALARLSVGNVRELQGAMNRLFAIQELEERSVEAAEVASLVGAQRAGAATREAQIDVLAPAAGPDARASHGNEFEAFVADIAGTVDAVLAISPAEGLLRDPARQWTEAGFATARLERAIADPGTIEDAESAIASFNADVERLRSIASEIGALQADAPELARTDVLRDPDALEAAEALLAAVRDRVWPLPGPPDQPTLDALPLPGDLFAFRAARAVAEQPGERYNPFFVHGPDGAAASGLLSAIGASLRTTRPDWQIAWLGGSAFAAELIQAIEKNRVDAWRARYARARVLLIDGLDALEGTDRAQEELFHLFESLHRGGAQLVFSADRPPTELSGIDERLRTRLGSGLVAELPPLQLLPTAEPPAGPAAAAPDAQPKPAPAEAAAAPHAAAAAQPPRVRQSAALPLVSDDWFLSREKLLWDWPYPEDLLVQELE